MGVWDGLDECESVSHECESFSKSSYKKHKRDDLFIIAAMCNVEATEWQRAETNKQDTPCLL